MVVACDVAITGHQAVISQQFLSGNSSLGWSFLNQLTEHPHGKRDARTDEFAGGPGNGTASGERPPLLCFALVLFIT